MTAGDEITLTLPAERDFFGVAHLVLGGLAVRLNLTFESLEDIQLALDGVLDRDLGEREMTVRVSVGAGTLETVVGPFDDETLRRELEREPGEDVSLRRVLDAVVDDVGFESRDGGHWIRLIKRVEALQGA